MADVQSNIQVSIDTTQALASIKNLQRQISAFHSSMAKGGAAANAVSAQMQQTLLNSINAGGKFSAQIRTIKTTTESFTDSLQKNKFSIGEYFRYAGGASKTFGRLFKTEFDTINKVARENVKDLQTQYIRLGRDASGAMKSIAVRPLSLDMTDLGTRTQIAAQKQALLNQLLKQGSTNLLNFGKNTQWAGRQLMVGFTLPLMAVGSAAAKTFMDMETQAIRFKKVYGDLFTPQAESQKALKEIEALGREFTKYGIAVSSTVGLAAEAAAAGFQGADLQRQTSAATKLSILGQVESQKALETTIALQNAFSMSSENLAESIDFLNAVENQTVLSLDDMSTAIPKAAPVVQQLGGDVKDLAFLMTAMKEGGINASEGANALKSGLASLINPTGKANDMLLSFGINAKKIVLDNKGDLKKTVIEFATALNQLDPLNRAQTIEQMFGKFQFARLSTLFANVTKEGTQAARVLDLAGASVQDLAAMSEKELGMTSESAMNKFKGAVESLKLSLVPLGEEFLKAVTPVAEFVTKLLDKFNGLSDNTKKVIVTLTAIIGGLGPVFLMTFGLLANGLANIIKGFTVVKSLFNKTGQETGTLGTATKYMTAEQRNAAAVAASLDQVHTKLRQTFTSEAAAVNLLTQAYQRAVAAQATFMPVAAPMGRGPAGRGPAPTKRAKGKPAIVGGTGNKDSELALLMPGETVIPTKMSQKYGSIINAMIADRVPGYKTGVGTNFITNTPTSPVASHFDVTAPSELARTIRLLGDELDGFSTTVLKITENVDDAGYDLVKNQEELVKSVKDENAVLAGGRSFGGTTTLGTGSRNTMFNAIDVKGEPFTLDALAEAGDKATTALRENKTSTQKHTAELEQLSREGATATKLLQDSNGATRSRIEYMRNNAKQAITEGILADSRIKIDGKRITVQQARVMADERIAKVDAELEVVKRSGITQEKQVQAAKSKYLAAMLRSGTGEFVVAPAGTGGGVARDYATGRPRSSSRVRFLNRVAGERQAAYGGRGAVQISGLIAKDFALKGKSLVESAYLALVSGARSALRISSPSKEMHSVGANAGKGLVEGAKSQQDEAKLAGQRIGSSVVEGATQSGRRRRVATRGQGPAPIGATPQPGMTVLPIVPSDPKTSKPSKSSRFTSVMKGAGNKLGSTGGGMGLLGVNMGLSMAPDFAGKGIAQGALTGANLGMFLGPKGMALGATIGTVVSAFASLNAKMKEHAAISRSAFATSTSLITAFGDKVLDTSINIINLNGATDNLMSTFGVMTPEMKAAVDAIMSLPEDNPMSLFLKNISDSKLGIKSLTGEIRSNLSTAISVGGLDPKNAEAYVRVLLEASGRTMDFAEVWKSVSKSVVDAQTATTTSLDKMYDKILEQDDLSKIAFRGWSQFYPDESFLLSYKNLTSEQATFADGMLNLFKVLTNGSLTYEEIQERLNGIKDASFNAAYGVDALEVAINNTGNAALIGRFASIKQMFKDTGTEAQISTDKVIGMALALNTISDQGLLDFAKQEGIPLLPGSGKHILERYMESQQFKDFLAAQKKFQDAASGNDYKEYNDGIDKAKTASELYLEVLEKEITGLEAKRDAQKNANDETQRQIDLQKKLSDLAKESVLAKISGDYIKAANLQQQAQNVQAEFNLETELRKKDAEIARLKARAQEIKDGAKLTRVEKAKIPKNAKGKKAASGGMIRGAGTGTSDSIPAYLSNGEYVIKADSVKKYGVGTFDALNTQKFADGGLIRGYNDGGKAKKNKKKTPSGWDLKWMDTAGPEGYTLSGPPVYSNRVSPRNPNMLLPRSTPKGLLENEFGTKSWTFDENASNMPMVLPDWLTDRNSSVNPNIQYAMGGLIKGYKDGGPAYADVNPSRIGTTKPTPSSDSSYKNPSAASSMGLSQGFTAPWLEFLGIKGLQQTANKIFQGGKNKASNAFYSSAPNNWDYLNAALLPLNFTASGQKAAGQAATKVPSLLGPAVKRAVKSIPGSVKELSKLGIWNTLGKIKPLESSLYRAIGFKPRGLIDGFKNAYKYSERNKSFFTDIIDSPRISRKGGAGAPQMDEVDKMFDFGPPKLAPMEAFGELFGTAKGLFKNKIINPISSNIITPAKNAYGMSKNALMKSKSLLSKENISDFLYRSTPVGSIQALIKSKKLTDPGLGITPKTWTKSKSDIPSELDPSILDLFKIPTYHGGALPDQLINRLKPGEEGYTGSIFNFDLFTTADKLLARQYAIGKNAEDGGSIWQTIWNTPKDLSKVWDMRGGRKSLWSQNKQAYSALEKYFIESLGHTRAQARSMLLGERVPGTALVRGSRDRVEDYIRMNLNDIFSTTGKNGPEWLIDTIAHAGGAIQGGAQHSVLTTLDPEKNIKRIIQLLPKDELKKTFLTYPEMLESTVERLIEQYAKYGKTFPILGDGSFPGHKTPNDLIAATGGYINKGKVKVPKFAMGGLIKGPGTGISDSIQAGFGYAGGGSIRVSNGEYVVKAKSVRDYGVKTMDAINNGTATVGTNSSGTVYNINMPVTSNNADAEGVANEVMRKLKLEVSKNNKSNKVSL